MELVVKIKRKLNQQKLQLMKQLQLKGSKMTDQRRKTVVVDDTSESDDTFEDNDPYAINIEEHGDESRWLEEMIQEETEPIRPSNSKKSIKEGKTALPF